jgi:hypothetical protein
MQQIQQLFPPSDIHTVRNKLHSEKTSRPPVCALIMSLKIMHYGWMLGLPNQSVHLYAAEQSAGNNQGQAGVTRI